MLAAQFIFSPWVCDVKVLKEQVGDKRALVADAARLTRAVALAGWIRLDVDPFS